MTKTVFALIFAASSAASAVSIKEVKPQNQTGDVEISFLSFEGDKSDALKALLEMRSMCGDDTSVEKDLDVTRNYEGSIEAICTYYK